MVVEMVHVFTYVMFNLKRETRELLASSDSLWVESIENKPGAKPSQIYNIKRQPTHLYVPDKRTGSSWYSNDITTYYCIVLSVSRNCDLTEECEIDEFTNTKVANIGN